MNTKQPYIQIQEWNCLIVQVNVLFTAGALKMLGNLVESLKSVDKKIGDAVFYWGEFMHKLLMSDTYSSSQHVGRMFRSNNYAETKTSKTKYDADDTQETELQKSYLKPR